MRLCGYQPQYFPRLHYMNRVLQSDVYEISDYVQFVKKHAYELPDGTTKRGKSYQAHTIIKQVQGTQFLAVPTKGELLPINQTPIDYSRDWARDHLKSIEIAYRKAPNFEKFYPEIEKILKTTYDSIGELTVKTSLWGVTRLISYDPLPFETFTIKNINEFIKENNPYRLKTIFLASESKVPAPTKGNTNEWCIALCKYANADEYIYGGTSHNAYMNLEKFNNSGIKTVLQDWQIKEYQQQYRKAGFLPNLSVIDLVMNVPHDEATAIINN